MTMLFLDRDISEPGLTILLSPPENQGMIIYSLYANCDSTLPDGSAVLGVYDDNNSLKFRIFSRESSRFKSSGASHNLISQSLSFPAPLVLGCQIFGGAKVSVSASYSFF